MNQYLKKIILAIFVLSFISCKEDQKSSDRDLNATIIDSSKIDTNDSESDLRNQNIDLNKIHTDTVTFIAFNFDYDYSQMYFRKNKEEQSVIYDLFIDKKLDYNRGDILEIKWKIDTIYIAGDGETLDYSEWLIGAKKIKEGKLSLYKKTKRVLKYTWGSDQDYSDDFTDYLYNTVEYYLANSNKESVISILKDKESITTFSIEETTRENKEYIMIGLANDFEDHISTFQWLFIDRETNKLYEYDLPNDKLILFE